MEKEIHKNVKTDFCIEPPMLTSIFGNLHSDSRATRHKPPFGFAQEGRFFDNKKTSSDLLGNSQIVCGVTFGSCFAGRRGLGKVCFSLELWGLSSGGSVLQKFERICVAIFQCGSFIIPEGGWTF